jgi:hypothetical protein
MWESLHRWEHAPLPEIRAMVRKVFVRWWLPDHIRIDNGFPWGTPCDLPTERASWLFGLGVEPIPDPPGRPTGNPAQCGPTAFLPDSDLGGSDPIQAGLGRSAPVRSISG